GMSDSADSMVTYLEGLSETTSTLADTTSSVAERTGTLAESASTLEQDLTGLRDDAVTAAPAPESSTNASDLAADLAEQARTAAE
ncbi:hypothetical protein ABTM52_20165, partial [Acinetobacter baumannii]